MKKQLLFVNDEWLQGKLCLRYVTNPIEKAHARTLLEQTRRKFLAKLEQEGFEITMDKGVLEDAIYLIMNEVSLADKNVSFKDYEKILNDKLQAAGGSDMNVPYTISVEEYFNNPFFPAVFKNELANGGIDKFLIKNSEQLAIFKDYYDKHHNDKKTKDLLDMSVFQQYIETPTKYKTYIRVLMGASGEIMGASLKYSSLVKDHKDLKGFFEKIFCDSNSPYYLNCDSMFGYYSDGGEISFSQPKYSREKQEILLAHDIDPTNPQVPEGIRKVASNIMEKCNKELGIICGMDFIQDVTDGKWYYLENQAFPAIDEWAKPKGYRIPTAKSVKDYLKYLDIELDARYAALM